MQINAYLLRLKEATFQYHKRGEELHRLSHNSPEEHPAESGEPVETDLENPADQQPDAAAVSRSGASTRAIATRQGKYGETKLKKKTQEQMKDAGANIRQQKLEKKGKDGRAN